MTPELKIYGDIGDSVTAETFIAELEALGDVPEVCVRINSDGGSFTDGIAIYNALKRHNAKVITVVDGAAFSAASYIAMAGDEREMASNAMMMIHGAMVDVGTGTEQEYKENLELIQGANQSMAKTYAEITGKPTEETTLMLGKNNWMTADKAMSEGFVTKIGTANDLAAVATTRILSSILQPGVELRLQPGDQIAAMETEDMPETKPKAATLKQLKAISNNAEFIVKAMEEEMPEPDAMRAYIRSMEEENEELKSRITAMEEEIANGKLAAMEEEEVAAMEEEVQEEKPTARSGAKAIANGRQKISDPISKWNDEVDKFVSKYPKNRAKAVRMANKNNPGLRAQMLKVVNG